MFECMMKTVIFPILFFLEILMLVKIYLHIYFNIMCIILCGSPISPLNNVYTTLPFSFSFGMDIIIFIFMYCVLILTMKLYNIFTLSVIFCFIYALYIGFTENLISVPLYYQYLSKSDLVIPCIIDICFVIFAYCFITSVFIIKRNNIYDNYIVPICIYLNIIAIIIWPLLTNIIINAYWYNFWIYPFLVILCMCHFSVFWLNGTIIYTIFTEYYDY